MRGLARWTAAAAILAAVVAACQEHLTSPADCPALCPGGSAQLFDTVVPAVANRDSSFPTAEDLAAGGYVNPGQGTALLLSSGFPPSEDRAVYRFAPRTSLISVRDTQRTYTVDSASITMTLVARDTTVHGLHLIVYRLPSTVDSTATFAGIDPLLTDPNLIDTIAVPDSVLTGTVSTMLRGDTLNRIALVGADSSLAIGLRMTANGPTGIRLGAMRASNAATLTTYVTVDVPDTGALRHQIMNRATAFNTFVTQAPLVPVDSLLTVGGAPSSRALIRFGLPNAFLDSTTIVRATLELTPVQPIVGLLADPAFFEIKAVVGDLGAKSPVTGQSTFTFDDTLPVVQSDTVRADITSIVQFWQSARTTPQSIFVSLRPEAATFAQAVFFSTRSHGPDPAVLVAPRLRITYQRSFAFESP
ncbi:MAG: hypothetical protein ACTHM9_01655 [Gemmatimonadales bacterium]